MVVVDKLVCRDKKKLPTYYDMLIILLDFRVYQDLDGMNLNHNLSPMIQNQRRLLLDLVYR